MTMSRVHRHRLPIGRMTDLALPAGYVPVDVGRKKGTPHDAVELWVQVPSGPASQTGPPVVARFEVIATGKGYHDDWEYLGAVIDGELVWHVIWKVPA